MNAIKQVIIDMITCIDFKKSEQKHILLSIIINMKLTPRRNTKG